MKLDAQAPRRDGPRENRYEPASRGGRHGQGAGHGRSAPAAGATAMASAFEKLKGLGRG
jgi:uncharacterized protein